MAKPLDTAALEAWLVRQSAFDAQMAPLRAVLRALPVLIQQSAPNPSGSVALAETLLPPLALSWTCAVWPDLRGYYPALEERSGENLRVLAAQARTQGPTTVGQLSEMERSLVAAVDWLSMTPWDPMFLETTASILGELDGWAPLESEIAYDRTVVDRSATLAGQPLWNVETASDNVEAHRSLMAKMREAGGTAHAWAEWAEARFIGGVPSKSVEHRRLAALDGLFAARIPSATASVQEPEAEWEDHADLAPIPGAFVIERVGAVLEARPFVGETQQPVLAHEFAQGLGREIQRAMTRLTANAADKDLTGILSDLLTDLNAPPSSAPIGTLRMSFIALDSQAAKYGDPSRELDRDVHALIVSIARGLSEFMALYPATRTLEASRIAMGVSSGADQKSVQAAMRGLARG